MVQIVPTIVVKDIFSSKNIAPNIKAEVGTKNIKLVTSFAPSFVTPTKYIEVANVVLSIVIINKFNQNIKS